MFQGYAMLKSCFAFESSHKRHERSRRKIDKVVRPSRRLDHHCLSEKKAATKSNTVTAPYDTKKNTTCFPMPDFASDDGMKHLRLQLLFIRVCRCAYALLFQLMHAGSTMTLGRDTVHVLFFSPTVALPSGSLKQL